MRCTLYNTSAECLLLQCPPPLANLLPEEEAINTYQPFIIQSITRRASHSLQAHTNSENIQQE